MTKKTVLNGLAGAAAVAGATQGYAAIVSIPLPANIPGNNPANTSTTPTNRNIDIDGDGTADLSLSYRAFTTGNYVLQQSFIYAFNTGNVAGEQVSDTQFYAFELATGAIPAVTSFGNSVPYRSHLVTNVNGDEYGAWYLGDRGYVAFSFLNHNTNQTNYGYFEVETDAYVSAANPGGLRFFSAAYDNTGAQIAMGAAPTGVPEPGTLAALAFGGLGLGAAAYRRRKQQSAPVA